jgi:2-dehydropantoate 2-reductase
MPSIAIVGPGAIGGTLAAWLAQNPDNHLTLCARTALERVCVDSPLGRVEASPAVITNPEQAQPVDWVVIATKAYHTEGTALWLPGLLAPHTRVVIVQNGVEHVARFSPYVPAEALIPAIIDVPVERSAPGQILQRRAGTIVVPDGADGRAFAALFTGTGITATTSDDFLTVAWRKLCVNSPGAVSALTLKPSGIVAFAPAAEIMRGLIRECIAVGRAEGAALDDALVQTIIANNRAAAPTGMNSMFADRIAGRPMEIDARNGVVVRLGEKHGIDTPLHRVIVALLQATAA